jgi:hypothetical protein
MVLSVQTGLGNLEERRSFLRALMLFFLTAKQVGYGVGYLP